MSVLNADGICIVEETPGQAGITDGNGASSLWPLTIDADDGEVSMKAATSESAIHNHDLCTCISCGTNPGSTVR